MIVYLGALGDTMGTFAMTVCQLVVGIFKLFPF